jgi:hypothetical protein
MRVEALTLPRRTVLLWLSRVLLSVTGEMLRSFGQNIGPTVLSSAMTSAASRSLAVEPIAQ